MAMKLSEVQRLLEEAVAAAEAFFAETETRPVLQALEHYATLKNVADGIGGATKLLNKLQQYQQYGVIPKMMIGANIRSHTHDTLGVRFGLSTRTSAKILDKPQAYAWLRSQGAGDIITETVNAQTLGSFAGAYQEEHGLDLPDGIFEVKQATYATITKVKKR